MSANTTPPQFLRSVRRIQTQVNQLNANLAADFNGPHVRCRRPTDAVDVSQLIGRLEQLLNVRDDRRDRRHKTRTLYIGSTSGSTHSIVALLQQETERTERRRRRYVESTCDLDAPTDEEEKDEEDTTGSSESSGSGSDASAPKNVDLWERLRRSRAQFGSLFGASSGASSGDDGDDDNHHQRQRQRQRQRRCAAKVPGQRFLHCCESMLQQHGSMVHSSAPAA